MRFERWLYTVPLRFRSLFRRSAVERELDDELRDHVERETLANLDRGMSEHDKDVLRAGLRKVMANIDAFQQEREAASARADRLVRSHARRRPPQ